MSLDSFFWFAVVGKLLIFVLAVSPLGKIKIKIWDEMIHCDLCFGVWVYFGLAILFHIDIMSGTFFHIPIIGELITGIATSYIVHLISMGFKAKFTQIVIKD
jgi:hypothetical protein